MAESLRTIERFKRDSPSPALLRHTVFARWDSVTGPTVVRAWPDLIMSPMTPPDGNVLNAPATNSDPSALTSDIARFIARNCLTAEVTNSATFGNKVNSRIFTVPELGLVAYALVFACIPMKAKSKTTTPMSSRRPSTTVSVVFLPPGPSSSEQLFAWFFLFDAAITRIIDMRAIFEETILTRYVYLLRVSITKNCLDYCDAREVNLPLGLLELLDSQAAAYEKMFSTFAACLLLPAIRFSSTAFAVSAQQVGEDSVTASLPPKPASESEDSPKEGGKTGLSAKLSFWRLNNGSVNSDEMRFVRRSIAAFLASGGRALVLGQSSKSVNAMVYTLAMFLPLHCRRLCRLAAARPNESFLPGFYVQGIVGAPYPTGTELLMSPHALAITNTHDRSVCRTPPPLKHRLSAAAFTAARIRDAWEGILEERDQATTSLAALSLSEESIPDESIVGDFLLKLAMCSPFDNGFRQRFVESTVADFYTRAACLIQLVHRSFEQTSNKQSKIPVLSKREIAKLLDLRKPDGDLAVLSGVGELLQPGFAELYDRCPP